MFHPHQASQILFARWLMTLDKGSDLALMCADGLETYSTSILPLFLMGLERLKMVTKECKERISSI